MSEICTLKCPICNNFLAVYLNKMGKPQFYCGIDRFGFMVSSEEGIENFRKACEKIEETDLPEPTLKRYKQKLEEKSGKEESD